MVSLHTLVSGLRSLHLKGFSVANLSIDDDGSQFLSFPAEGEHGLPHLLFLKAIFFFFFLDGSMWIHITRLVIKPKSVSHILSSQKIDYLYTVPHHSAGGPSISRSSLCAACVSLLSLCTPHISYNETQEREPWLRGLAWEPALLSSHSTIYGGLSLL